MKNSTIINILIAGTGGQGVQTLSNWLRELALNKNLVCVGATFKGGAQRMGSVYTELRVQTNTDDKIHFSSQIPVGEVDVLIAFEPWEALRFANRCNARTKVIVNTEIQVLYVERFQSKNSIDPIETLRKTFTNPILKNHTAIAEKTTQFLNSLLIEDAVNQEFLPFTRMELKQIKQIL